MNNVVIDINKVEAQLKERHDGFMESLGTSFDKTIADSKLFSEMVFSRMYFVLLRFSNVGVIDGLDIQDSGVIKTVVLSKRGCSNTIMLSTNGVVIKKDCSNYSSLDHPVESKIVYGVGDDDFDWEDFAMRLLNDIHAYIYEQQKAFNTKLDLYFEDDNV